MSRHITIVSEGGLEPPRPCGHQPLKLARLPIPPLRLACDSEERPESVARGRLPSVAPYTACLRVASGRWVGQMGPQGPGRDGVVLLVDSGTLTAQYWAYHSRLLFVGVGVTWAILRLEIRAVGSVKRGRGTLSSHSCTSPSG